MTTLKDNLTKVKAGKLTGKHQTSQRQPRKGNGKGIHITGVDRKLFCRELIKNSMDSTAAYKAIRPRVTLSTARSNGRRLLSEAGTVKILQPLLQRIFVKAGIDADYVFKRWVEMAEASPLDYFHITEAGELGGLDLTDLTRAQRSNLQSIKVTDYKNKQGDVTSTAVQVKVLNQQKAVEMIAKHLGLLVDRMAQEDVERIGDVIERGISRIKKSRDLEGWRDIELTDADFTELAD